VPGIECLAWFSSAPFVSKIESSIGQQALFRINLLSLWSSYDLPPPLSHFLSLSLYIYIYSSIHLAVRLTRGPKPLPKRTLHTVRSRASSFKWQNPLLSLKSSSSFLRLLPRLPVTSILPCIFPSIIVVMVGSGHTPAAFPPGKTRYPLYSRLGGPQGRSGRVRKISPPAGFDPRTVQPIASRYTDWAIPARCWCPVPAVNIKYRHLFFSTIYVEYILCYSNICRVTQYKCEKTKSVIRAFAMVLLITHYDSRFSSRVTHKAFVVNATLVVIFSITIYQCQISSNENKHRLFLDFRVCKSVHLH
jgi:hypothetical protein